MAKSARKPAPRTEDRVPEVYQDLSVSTEQVTKAPKVKKILRTKYTPANDHVITVVPGCKGKKPGTKAGDRWAILSANSGKSYAEIAAAYEQAGEKVKGPKSLQSDMTWNLAHNLVTFA